MKKLVSIVLVIIIAITLPIFVLALGDPAGSTEVSYTVEEPEQEPPPTEPPTEPPPTEPPTEPPPTEPPTEPPPEPPPTEPPIEPPPSEQQPDPPPNPPSGNPSQNEQVITPPGTYEIIIPARISLNSEQDIVFSARNVNIAEDRAVLIFMSGENFDESGSFWLTGSGDDRIGVDFYRKNFSGLYEKIDGLTPDSTIQVAVFGNGDTTPWFGGLRLSPSQEDIESASPDTYTNTVRFTVFLGYR